MAGNFFYSKLHQIDDIAGIHSTGAGIQALATKPAAMNSGNNFPFLTPSGKADHTAQTVVDRHSGCATGRAGSAIDAPVNRRFSCPDKVNYAPGVRIKINLPVGL
jgi:hypothetical protein